VATVSDPPEAAALAFDLAPDRRLLYAGFWRRVAARLIDMALLGAVQGALAVGILIASPGDLQALAKVGPVGLALNWAYYTVLQSSPARATVGKLALDIFVADSHGDQISFLRANVRYWAEGLNYLLLLAGYVMAAFTHQKQALHDLLAGTLVLRGRGVQALAERRLQQPFTEQWDGSRWIAR